MFTFKKKLRNIFNSDTALIATTKYGNIEITDNFLIVPINGTVTYKYNLVKHMWRKYDKNQVFGNAASPIISLNSVVVYDPVLFNCFEYYDASDDEILEMKNNYYRTLRSKSCFTVINRGQLWYDRLKQEQLNELTDWYDDWLNITNTYVIPTEPSWINDKLNDLEEEVL